MPDDTVPTDGRREDALRRRLLQAILVMGTVGSSWYAMMAVHEAGHAITAALTGGKVTRVVVPLLGFSGTDLARNPHPLLVVWGGQVLGCILPLALWGLLRLLLLGFGVVAAAGGFALWNGLGPRFGIGEPREQVDARATALMAAAFLATAALVAALG